jgi:levanase
MLGWMNNWNYGQDTPTTTWRGTMALPREMQLISTLQGPRLTQHVVAQADALKNNAAAYTASQPQDIPPGTSALPVSGDVVRIDAEFSAGNAASFGLKVLGNGTEATRIGYSTGSGRAFIDRTNSGNDAFHPAFASVDDVPLPLIDGRLHLRIYVDRASVEVFAQNGLATLTDQVFPAPGADKLAVFSEGGTARLENLTVTPLNKAMW